MQSNGNFSHEGVGGHLFSQENSRIGDHQFPPLAVIIGIIDATRIEHFCEDRECEDVP